MTSRSLPPFPSLELPDRLGFYGRFGGAFVPEILHANIEELARTFREQIYTEEFWNQYCQELRDFSGRPTPVTHLKNLSASLGGAQLWLKREDLNQTGAHKVNNVVGQGLVAKRLGKKRLIAETGAGQHGVATATIAARLGMEATIYMGSVDVARQRPNVFWMQRLGARVVAVEEGQKTLKDAINEAMRDWSTNPESSHYLLGTACGPHPFPAMVMFFQSVVGQEARQQVHDHIGRMPTRVYACVGGGSNATGIFCGFEDLGNSRFGVEAGGTGVRPGQHARRFGLEDSRDGIAQGYRTHFLQDADGQMLETHSIAAGLDYVGVSPILAHWYNEGKVSMTSALDQEVIQAAEQLMKHEGIIPALESSHALSAAIKDAPKFSKSDHFLINLSGRGDKDIFNFARIWGDQSWNEFLRNEVKG